MQAETVESIERPRSLYEYKEELSVEKNIAMALYAIAGALSGLSMETGNGLGQVASMLVGVVEALEGQ